MQCGDIYAWYTQQAKNQRGKYKYHLCICVKEGKFLFINSSGDDRSGAFWITKTDWPDMPKDKSFISCNGLLTYAPKNIKQEKPKGRLTDDALKRLLDHIAVSEIMTGAEIDVICDAIETYLQNK